LVEEGEEGEGPEAEGPELCKEGNGKDDQSGVRGGEERNGMRTFNMRVTSSGFACAMRSREYLNRRIWAGRGRIYCEVQYAGALQALCLRHF
jgi:hypothetical protein